mgnify:CR=1 FL=1
MKTTIRMPPYIRFLQAIGFGKRIRQEGPESHFIKEGTPTMGGLLLVVVVVEPLLGAEVPDFGSGEAVGVGVADDFGEAAAGGGDRERQIERARDAWYRGFVAEAIDRFCSQQEVMDVSGQRNKGAHLAQSGIHNFI